MKLDDFLKVKTVRCVSKNAEDNLTIGKEYKVTHIIFGLQSDNNAKGFYDFDSFEPTPNQAENSLQDMELTPEFEAVEPKFKVGDKVYCPSLLDGSIYIVRENSRYLNDGCELFVINDHEDCFDFEADGSNQYHNPIVYHATEENRQALQVLHHDIDFEAPPKELTGSDLARAMVDKGWFIVDCYVSAISDEDALRFRNKRMQVALFGDGLFTDGVKQFPFAVPFDPKTSEPLTESVLND